MGLTRNLRRIGMAAYTEKRDTQEWIEAERKAEAKRREQADLTEENTLMLAMIEKHGDCFVEWYDSPAIPERGRARDRINMIVEWDKKQVPA